MLRTLAAGLVIASITLSAQSQPDWLDAYRPVAERLISTSASTDFAWRRLAELTDTYGSRLSGTSSLESAIDWAVAEMKKDGLENVHKEPVMVPHWVRGQESLDLVQPVRERLVLLGLGGSVPTPPGGIEADVLVVKSLDELNERSSQVRGRIVLYNEPFTNYEQAVTYRRVGPSRASRLGAVAVLVRSVGVMGLRTAHTGSTSYAPDAPRVPAAAIPAEDAERFQRLQDRGVAIRVRLVMDGHHFEPDAQSYNVVGELRGRDLPEEIVLVGGHIDSWDVGSGAVDDGGGCIVTWEALRLMKQLGLQPRRTVRVVLFTNEENGTRGGTAYRDAHLAELPNHVALLESDIGIFDPSGFGFTYDPANRNKPGSERATAAVSAIASLLASIGGNRIAGPGEEADIEPSGVAGNIPMLALNDDGTLTDPRYFAVHHTAADTVARLTPKQVADNAAAVAVMSYVLADLPFRLGER